MSREMPTPLQAAKMLIRIHEIDLARALLRKTDDPAAKALEARLKAYKPPTPADVPADHQLRTAAVLVKLGEVALAKTLLEKVDDPRARKALESLSRRAPQQQPAGNRSTRWLMLAGGVGGTVVIVGVVALLLSRLGADAPPEIAAAETGAAVVEAGLVATATATELTPEATAPLASATRSPEEAFDLTSTAVFAQTATAFAYLTQTAAAPTATPAVSPSPVGSFAVNLADALPLTQSASTSSFTVDLPEGWASRSVIDFFIATAPNETVLSNALGGADPAPEDVVISVVNERFLSTGSLESQIAAYTSQGYTVSDIFTGELGAGRWEGIIAESAAAAMFLCLWTGEDGSARTGSLTTAPGQLAQWQPTLFAILASLRPVDE